MITQRHHKNPALNALHSILQDSNYFRPNGAYTVSLSLRGQIETAVEESDAMIQAASESFVQQIVQRLMTHFPPSSREAEQRLTEDYIQMLRDYPEDLLAAAYHHVLKHHKYNNLPKIADLTIVMEPEMMHRKSIRNRLEILLRQTEKARTIETPTTKNPASVSRQASPERVSWDAQQRIPEATTTKEHA
ncbi:MAG: hypothetical protein SFT92_02060 [Rickettsiales bacterium]|nr:hypothetical protein [Rickettsiales bacterium]